MSDRQQTGLGEFATEYGTTDDIREGVELNPPEDGHLRRVNEIHDYWHGLERRGDGYYNSQSLVPPGTVNIILDADPELLERGWGLDLEYDLKPGVWLTSRGHIGSIKPPTPVDIDDDYLRFAAEACLLAAKQVVTDHRPIMLTTSLHETLTVYVADEDTGSKEQLFDGGGIGGIPPRDGADTRHGFFNIRMIGTPTKIYSMAEVPRLSLEELRVDIPERWSA